MQPQFLPPQIDMPNAPQLPARTGIGGLVDRIGGGLGTLSTGLFQPLETEGVDPALIEQRRREAMLTLGLGMLAGKERGYGFGQSALQGLGMAQGSFQGALQTAYNNAMRKQNQQFRQDVAKRADNIAQWNARQRLEEFREQGKQFEREIALREKLGGAQVAASGASTAATQEQLRITREREARLRELMAKPDKTPAEVEEMNILSGGTPQGLTAAQARDPFAMLGLGGGGQFGGTGGSGTFNPNDPALNSW